MPISIDQVLDWRGRKVLDRDGGKIGTFDEIYLDEGTNEPAWAAVKIGLFGLRRRVVPISAAELNGSDVRLPFTKDQITSAPAIDSEGWVPERDQTAILRHYGLGAQEPAPRAGSPSPESSGTDEADANASPQNRLRLKRHTVTETLTRRSEYGAD